MIFNVYEYEDGSYTVKDGVKPLGLKDERLVKRFKADITLVDWDKFKDGERLDLCLRKIG